MAGPDGREYRYVQVGSAAALIVGNLIQGPAEDTSESNIAVAAAAVGDKVIVTTTTLTVTVNEYAGGYIFVAITPGLGQIFKIKSHPAVTAAALTIQLEDPIQVALTTTSRLDMVHDPYNGVIQHPGATPSGVVVGVAVNDISASQFGWIQVSGPVPILDDGGIAVGTQVIASNGTAGAVEDVASTTQQIVGRSLQASASGEQAIINLNLN